MNVQTKVKFTLGYFRILHALPDMPSVDVYVNDKLITEELSYGEYTTYFPMIQEFYTISLYESGTKDVPILTSRLTISPKELITLATIKTPNGIGFFAIPDANTSIDPSKAMIRFVNLSPNAPALDITLPDGTILFSNISFKDGSPYMAVEPLIYTLQVRTSGTSTVLLTVPNINLDPNYFYTVYAIGLLNEEPQLEGFYLLDAFK